MAKVSVIVPVYMAEQYIERCIDSVINQSFQDFELILIDDGSSDNCGNICDEYAKADMRIKVIHQKNKGVSAARNRGLAVATGTYVVFIDSDDWVGRDYLEDLLLTEADFVSQSFSVYNEHEDFIREHRCGTYSTSNIPSNLLSLLEDGVLGYTVSKRFTLKLIHDHEIRFNEAIDHTEDTLFILDYLQYAQSIRVEDKSNYCYVRYNTRETLSGTATYDRLIMASTANYIICNRFFQKGSDKYEKLFYSRVGYSYISYIGNTWYVKLNGFLKKYFFLCALLENEDVQKTIKYAPNALWKLPAHEKVIRALLRKNKLHLAYACLYTCLSKCCKA